MSLRRFPIPFQSVIGGPGPTSRAITVYCRGPPGPLRAHLLSLLPAPLQLLAVAAVLRRGRGLSAGGRRKPKTKAELTATSDSPPFLARMILMPRMRRSLLLARFFCLASANFPSYIRGEPQRSFHRSANHFRYHQRLTKSPRSVVLQKNKRKYKLNNL